ncbi:protein TRACHEARY ELEMENT DIFFERENTIATION-RELATED 7A-like [Thunnus maccoyii]|uniref:protein TRACHEARY ELEMENT DIFFERENTIATION-RELATED 7A-like n=1 Tax=Thunnus maccoyii TaxID=8240 RepID=UPI001C4C7A4D|nr:protein TRACHEARY ELEMENT DIFFERENTIATION-RELATED 7A-like [Thunnus maccoyii]
MPIFFQHDNVFGKKSDWSRGCHVTFRPRFGHYSQIATQPPAPGRRIQQESLRPPLLPHDLRPSPAPHSLQPSLCPPSLLPFLLNPLAPLLHEGQLVVDEPNSPVQLNLPPSTAGLARTKWRAEAVTAALQAIKPKPSTQKQLFPQPPASGPVCLPPSNLCLSSSPNHFHFDCCSVYHDAYHLYFFTFYTFCRMYEFVVLLLRLSLS